MIIMDILNELPTISQQMLVKRHRINAMPNAFYFNDALILTTTRPVFDGNMPILLFASYTGGDVTNSLDNGFYGRCYGVKIRQDNVLVRNFIPCLDNNNVPCLYDSVTQQPFYNQGHGQFGYGV